MTRPIRAHNVKIRTPRTCMAVVKSAALAAATAGSALALASAAHADVFDKHLTVDCPQPFSQQCPGNAGMRVHTTGPLYVKFTADGNPPACAPGDATIVLNDWNAKEAVLQPGQSLDFAQMRNEAEDVYTEVRMAGVLGGCNTGSMSGWSGNLHVETDNDALRHLPHQSPLAPH
jgi:hypothetical protein